MFFRGLFLLIMFILTISVTSLKGDTTVQPRYHFNHPPSAGYYNPIPVSVVYEDNSDFSGKSVNSSETDNSFESEENITTEKNVKTGTEEEENPKTTVATEKVDEKTRLVPKPRALQDLQIPVAVVYESDPHTENHHKTDTNVTKRRSSNRRNQKSKADVDIVNKPTQESKREAGKTGSIETSTFGKRTGERSTVVPIIESENYVFSHSGNFHYRYEGGDGTKAYSEGKLKTVEDETGEAVVGGFSYTDKDGNDFSLSYTADENGYRPVGAHLPTPPPIPPAIARALAYLATATPEPVTKRPLKSQPLVRR